MFCEWNTIWIKIGFYFRAYKNPIFQLFLFAFKNWGKSQKSCLFRECGDSTFLKHSNDRPIWCEISRLDMSISLFKSKYTLIWQIFIVPIIRTNVWTVTSSHVIGWDFITLNYLFVAYFVGTKKRLVVLCNWYLHHSWALNNLENIRDSIVHAFSYFLSNLKALSTGTSVSMSKIQGINVFTIKN